MDGDRVLAAAPGEENFIAARRHFWDDAVVADDGIGFAAGLDGAEAVRTGVQRQREFLV